MDTKNKIVILFLLLSHLLYSDEFFSQDSINEYRPIGVIGDQRVNFRLQNESVLLKFSGSYKLSNYWPEIKEDSFSFSKDDIILKNDGYSYVKLFIWEESILYGNRFLLIMNDQSNFRRHGYNGIGTYQFRVSNGDFGPQYYPTYIKCIESSSYLQEGDFYYTPDALSKYLGIIYYTRLNTLPMPVFNENAHPWVEGVDGPGIGEVLIISFIEPCSDVILLNGFVDRNRKHLFKANNRVKTAIIRSDDSGEPFEFEYQFEDMVRFDEIQFPRPVEKIVFEIKDVYPGEIWDDTCISAVLTKEPDPYK